MCRFCGMKLAEGAIGNVNELPEGTSLPSGLVHPLRVMEVGSIHISNPSMIHAIPAAHVGADPADVAAAHDRSASGAGASPSGRPPGPAPQQERSGRSVGSVNGDMERRTSNGSGGMYGLTPRRECHSLGAELKTCRKEGGLE